MTEPVLSVRDLHVTFHYKKRMQGVIRGMNSNVYTGKCLGVLRESGSGKDMDLRAVIGLLDQSFSVRGEAVYQGKDLTRTGGEGLGRIRGRRIATILQSPIACFDSLYRIGHQVAETYGEHSEMGKEEIHACFIEVL